MKASIIIATFNGEKKISCLLNALINQTCKEFEVIVVIDGSSDKTHDVVEAFRPQFQNFRYVHQTNQGRSITRNNGAKLARGNVVIFYDDDMEPFPDSIQRHIDFHQNHFGLLCGRPIEVENSSQVDIQNYRAGLGKKWLSKYSSGLNQMRFDNLFFTASSFSILKDTFETLGGFDNRLTDAEDYDLAYRALEKNTPVYFDKDNLSLHREEITCLSYIKRIRQYSMAHLKLASLHPDRSFLRPPDVSLPRKVFYFFFSFSFWIPLADQERLTFLPKAWRFKLYDWIIFSLGTVFIERKL